MNQTSQIVGLDGKPLFKQKAKVVREFYFNPFDDEREAYIVVVETEDGEAYQAGFELNPENPIVEWYVWEMIEAMFEKDYKLEIVL